MPAKKPATGRRSRSEPSVCAYRWGIPDRHAQVFAGSTGSGRPAPRSFMGRPTKVGGGREKGRKAQAASEELNNWQRMAAVLAGSAAAATEHSTKPGETTSYQLSSTTSTSAQPLTAPTLTRCSIAMASATFRTVSHSKTSWCEGGCHGWLAGPAHRQPSRKRARAAC